MTTATPSSLNLTEKKRLWNEYKFDMFEDISKDKSTLFNYFLVNNDIFKMISKKDEMLFRMMEHRAEDEKSTVFFGSVLAVLLIDQVLLRVALPRFRITRFRPLVNFGKYVVVPCAAYTIYKDYFMDEYIYNFYTLQEKYGFGFQDYMKANRIFERALAVDRLEELREKREAFDWRMVPELPQEKPVR